MNGWRIFLHSVRMVLDNLGVAFRISGLLYLAQALSQFFMYLQASKLTQFESDPGEVLATPGFAMESLAVSLLAILAGLWIAVSWHRYILTGEEPRGWLPQWHGGAILGYLWRSILVGLVILGGMLAAMIVIMVVTMISRALGSMLVFGMIGLGGYMFFRLGLVLPAVALGRPMTMRESWQATKDDGGAIVALAFIVIGASLLVELPSMIDRSGASVVSLVYGIVVGWFVTMFGISVLTTLYGVFVERRSID